MTYTQTGAQNRTSPRQLLAIASKGALASPAAFAAWRRSVAMRRTMANLTDDQLRDIGHCKAPRREQEVEAGLITNLMSMR